MQQQHEDMLHLQQSFSQLFTNPTSEDKNSRVPANAPPSTLGNSLTPNSFSFHPSTSFGYRSMDCVRETPPPSPFTARQVLCPLCFVATNEKIHILTLINMFRLIGH